MGALSSRLRHRWRSAAQGRQHAPVERKMFCPQCIYFSTLTNIHSDLFPTPNTRAILHVLPLPDGPRTCRIGREESLRGAAVTCGGTKEEAAHRRCSAGSLDVRFRAPGQASHRRDLRPLCRQTPAGSRGGGGNGPVAGRLADAGRAFPHRHRKAKPVPDEADRCFRPLLSGWLEAASHRLSDADIIRRNSGRAQVAPSQTTHSPEARPACGPPD